ncbi:hypothetical protein JCM10908_004767 [Rhodotorula pacifica]|uniref:Mn(2+) transporter ATX2 n=1 Tax=Rhodotorula pacifica TaxID=1495444 RepID=UPI00316ECA0D
MGLAHLIGLSTAVLVSTLVASFAPLYAPLSQSKLEAISLLSSGILPGAALSVVIPEGVAALYRATEGQQGGGGGNDAPPHGGDHDAGEDNTKWIGLALLAGFLLMFLMDSVHGHDDYVDPTPHHHPHRHSSSGRRRPRRRPGFNPTPSHLAELEPLANGSASRMSHDDNEEDEYSSTMRDCSMEDRHDPAAGRCDVETGRPCRAQGRGIPRWDSAATLRGSRPPSPVRAHYHDHHDNGAHHDDDDEGDDESTLRGSAAGGAACPEGETDHHHHLMKADASSISTVVGLVAHSIADGISLGASSLPAPARSPSSAALTASSSSSAGGSSLQLIVFIAIMLHKAPTAFALASLLASSPANSRTFIRRALLVFSLAAPVGAILTYALLSLLGGGGGGGGGKNTEWYTGLALVFSGGTFLFVATHALREQEKREERKLRQQQQQQQAGFAYGGEEQEAAQQGLGHKARLALVLMGMVLPAVLSRLVGHGH